MDEKTADPDLELQMINDRIRERLLPMASCRCRYCRSGGLGFNLGGVTYTTNTAEQDSIEGKLARDESLSSKLYSASTKGDHHE